MNTSRLLKTIFSLGCVTTLLALVFTPKSEGYGEFIATVFFVFLCSFLLVYCLHALKNGEIEVKSITVKRTESPVVFWFWVVIYAIFSIFTLCTLILQAYT
ncbi:hypothetical protein XM47_11565 [Catenovulum maritimum]|uniref:Uncharacterized protein n=1 Tax=Catenovulum maritimum TaxID=1513271 RepID=A0A0J8GQA2_9ALTE|nr:hypothetical protein XM47_11565 [Catenovulum maritimum]